MSFELPIRQRFLESVEEYAKERADKTADFELWADRFETFAKLFYNATLDKEPK